MSPWGHSAVWCIKALCLVTQLFTVKCQISLVPTKVLMKTTPVFYEFVDTDGTENGLSRNWRDDIDYQDTALRNPYEDLNKTDTSHKNHNGESHPVEHAGVPRDLAALPTSLQDSDHELVFNVTWTPPQNAPAKDYSIEVRSETPTTDCEMRMCYEYGIPGDSKWWMVPSIRSPVAGECAIRPGCAYSIKLIAHPWDGHTSANLNVELGECVEGVCSCAHSLRLPTPKVAAKTVSVQGDLFVNISWTLPLPKYPQRLPMGLAKRAYLISVGKQMVSDAHPSPWFANAITRKVDTDGPVSTGDNLRWMLLPVVERGDQSDKRKRTLVLDVKLLARVSLIDERGCMGPTGNATAYDPAEARKVALATYLIWAALGGACVLAIVVIIAIGARGVKRLLKALRPASAPVPLEPLRRRPAWLPLQLDQIARV